MSQLDDIYNRHIAWYNGDDTTAEWPDPLSFVEGYELDKDSTPRKRAMAHEIVREDVPYLLELARKQQAALTEAEGWLQTLDAIEEADPTTPRHRNVSAAAVAAVIRAALEHTA